MNCKPGDLAVIVKPGSSMHNLGRLVHVLHALNSNDWWVEVVGGMAHGYWAGNTVFVKVGIVEDHRLRPIRDQSGDDESLTWKKVPSPTKEIA